ncbi:glutamate synthase-related protein, partial [Thiolapillus sp.]|uniref:glutamate synthase-related protein n=1 Tax=Thiolapillus sp. TaxID=2017437 RepID=UPI003AF48F64
TPRSEAYFVFPLAQGTPGKQCGLAATGVYQPSLRSPWLAAADFIVSARGFMFTLGCIQALQCNKNTCPTGITTHDRKLQRGLDPELKSTRVASYVKNMIYEVGMIAHACGISSPREFRRHHARVVQENGLSLPLQACLRPRDRFWDIPVPKIDSAFDNLLVPQPSWSPSTTQQL